MAERPASAKRPRAVAAGLAFLGYGPLGGGTWLAARAHADAIAVLAAEGVRAEGFFATYDGTGPTLASRAWDLAALAAAYQRFEFEAGALLDPCRAGRRPGPHGVRDPDRAGARVAQVPLPRPGSAGRGAAAGLARPPGRASSSTGPREELLPAAGRYVDTCLGTDRPCDEQIGR